ncbi:iron-containing alcohol dehydrogenase [Oceanicella actignis]|uniref:Alcohol dehydrogenase 2 n=1 Tax=Oceanicella actignis TaxID=1189325 RepID=A0A1M7TV87_9RHOB|nr:iron-containing alcohol dehydrogenase [Oceanicella actignis]TYO90457.1 alcohol dehydrogenase class IV [Oceanicella actignis]SES79884.1 Alcohol dehydrogenase, class IV [Oceanicella actignis]SHN74631.1 Alcohol dehydrogenase, class IV [Oceanicella actignis]
MKLVANWSYPTAIRFGAGRIAELPEACAAAGMRRPLLVTDRGLAPLPIVARALDALDAAGLGRALFSQVDPNPNEGNLAAGVAAFREGGHDGVVAFGGGSALDLGKLIAFMAGQTRPVWDFEDIGDWWSRADADAIAPIVAVPTTAGTGSEVGRAGVLTNSATHEKKIIFHPRMLPAQVICDPELTVSMPPAITAGTGLDAFAHCLEAFSSPFYHPMSQGIALEGMRLVKEWLPRAYATPGDLEARAHMMSAAAMGAVAFQKGLGAVHALSHPIGAMFNTHHGATNAVLIPAVMAFNRPAIEERIVQAAAYLGVEGGFDGFVRFFERLRADLGVPARLRELGVTEDSFAQIAAMSVKDPSAGGNPVELTEQAALELLRAAW